MKDIFGTSKNNTHGYKSEDQLRFRINFPYLPSFAIHLL